MTVTPTREDVLAWVTHKISSCPLRVAIKREYGEDFIVCRKVCYPAGEPIYDKHYFLTKEATDFVEFVDGLADDYVNGLSGEGHNLASIKQEVDNMILKPITLFEEAE